MPSKAIVLPCPRNHCRSPIPRSNSWALGMPAAAHLDPFLADILWLRSLGSSSRILRAYWPRLTSHPVLEIDFMHAQSSPKRSDRTARGEVSFDMATQNRNDLEPARITWVQTGRKSNRHQLAMGTPSAGTSEPDTFLGTMAIYTLLFGREPWRCLLALQVPRNSTLPLEHPADWPTTPRQGVRVPSEKEPS